jgi:hypothetical protein
VLEIKIIKALPDSRILIEWKGKRTFRLNKGKNEKCIEELGEISEQQYLKIHILRGFHHS